MKPGSYPAYDPTPKEIAAECERIRSEWSEAERARRMGARKVFGDAWVLPRFKSEVEEPDE